MNPREPQLPPVSQRLVLIASAMVAMGVVLLAILRVSTRGDGAPRETAMALDGPGALLSSDVGVVRTEAWAGQLAVPPEAPRRPDAHPRTMATYRLLRSYPGAPPRVPHGLTATEFRTNRCNTCHERGGYVTRFGAYAPVNPHPEWTSCLQCHAVNDLLVGLPFPQASPDDACRQCHAGSPERFDEGALNWRPAAWPPVGVLPAIGAPAIPHSLETRGDCLPCHAGPAAIAEIRTSHPERSACRQCHLAPGPPTGEYVRPIGGAEP